MSALFDTVAGDVCLRHKFTHTAEAAARIVIQNALFFGRAKLSALNIPWCTYTHPDAAHVGMYPAEAETRGIPTDTFKVEMSDIDRARTDGETEGFVKVLVKKGTGKILGATIVAAHAGDMISEISTAMAAKAGLKTLAGVIHPYPTRAEAIKRAGDAYSRTRLTPTRQVWIAARACSACPMVSTRPFASPAEAVAIFAPGWEPACGSANRDPATSGSGCGRPSPRLSPTARHTCWWPEPMCPASPPPRFYRRM